MKVLITGSSGYLGSVLTKSLISKKIYVVGIHRNKSKNEIRNEYYNEYHSCISNKEYINFIFDKEQPTHVIHLACTLNTIHNQKREYAIDIGGSKNILNAANNTLTVKQLIFSSSAAAYGGLSSNPEWISEQHPLSPGDYSYGINKKMVELAFSSAEVREDLRIIALRICTVTGPSNSTERTALKLLTDFPVLPKFCRDTKIQLLHIDDFVNLMELILQDDTISGTFNMAPDSYSLVRELAPDKKYIPVSVFAINVLLQILWNFRILNLQPTSIANSMFPIVLDPEKLISRYGYNFKYFTADAFIDTLLRNKKSLKSHEWLKQLKMQFGQH